MASKTATNLPLNELGSARDRLDAQSVLLSSYVKQNTTKSSSGMNHSPDRNSRGKMSANNKSMIGND